MWVGTLATELLEDRLTANPSAGAGPSRVTVPFEFEPPPTVVGLRVTPVKATDWIDRVAVDVDVPMLAAILAVAEERTAVVFIVKVADVVPAETVTLAGMVADLLLEDR
jgi:hypothetical protein